MHALLPYKESLADVFGNLPVSFTVYKGKQDLARCWPGIISSVRFNQGLLDQLVEHEHAQQIMRGISHHERGHVEDYMKASWMSLAFFGFRYAFYNFGSGEAMKLYEQLTDLRAIQRGSGEDLKVFREHREELAGFLNSTFDKRDVYLSPDQITHYMSNPVDLATRIATIEERLGIAENNVFGRTLISIAVRKYINGVSFPHGYES